MAIRIFERDVISLIWSDGIRWHPMFGEGRHSGEALISKHVTGNMIKVSSLFSVNNHFTDNKGKLLQFQRSKLFCMRTVRWKIMKTWGICIMEVLDLTPHLTYRVFFCPKNNNNFGAGLWLYLEWAPPPFLTKGRFISFIKIKCF